MNMNCEIIRFHDDKDIIDIFTKNKFTGVIHIASNVLVEHDTSNIESLMSSNITFGTYN